MGATALAMLTGKEPETLPHRGLAIDVDAALDPRTDPALRNVLKQMLEPDPDRRPTRIEPLLAGVKPRNARREEGRSTRADRPSRAQEDAWAGDDRSRHARRVAREITRDARREARHGWRNDHRLRLPFVLRLPIGVVLTLLQLAVVLVLHVALPFARVLLSLLFGRSLRRAARSVRRHRYGAGGAASRRT